MSGQRVTRDGNEWASRFKVVRKQACSTVKHITRPASNVARMGVDVQLCFSPVSSDFLQLTVSGGNAVVSWNPF